MFLEIKSPSWHHQISAVFSNFTCSLDLQWSWPSTLTSFLTIALEATGRISLEQNFRSHADFEGHVIVFMNGSPVPLHHSNFTWTTINPPILERQCCESAILDLGFYGLAVTHFRVFESCVLRNSSLGNTLSLTATRPFVYAARKCKWSGIVVKPHATDRYKWNE